MKEPCRLQIFRPQKRKPKGPNPTGKYHDTKKTTAVSGATNPKKHIKKHIKNKTHKIPTISTFNHILYKKQLPT